jgi:hypothetical protein
MQQFQGETQLYSYTLQELGLYYRIHDELMNHWISVLPGRIMEVVYEDVVADMEGQTRRILDFLGLEWDAACLNFHKTEKMVITASIDQVRKPIYNSSVQRWKKYARHLAPLAEMLGPLIADDDRDFILQASSS